MDRRSFFKTIFLVPSLTPFILARSPKERGFELCIISDSPQLVISDILLELRNLGLIHGNRYNFPNSHPREEELRKALCHNGWKCVSMYSQVNFNLTYSYLQKNVPSSFTFIKNGRIWDIRSRELFSIWKEMNKNDKLSSFLTIVSLKDRHACLHPGSFADIFMDGRRVDRMPLKKNFSKLFRAQNGNISVVVKERKAFVSDSSCRHKICLYSPPVSFAGERIICAPNRFLLEIKGHHSIDTSIG